MNVEAYIQSIVLKKTVETISFDRRKGLESGLNAEESWERASMGVIMRSEMHEEPIPPLKEAKREEDGVKILKPKNNTPLISQGGTTLEEPTNNINEESDVEEETIVVKELVQNFIANDMISANTTFLHKEMHEFTRAGPSRNEKSIIDYIMVKRSDHKKPRDSRACDFFETTILNIAEAVCGKYKSNGKNFKPTRWWFEFINTEIKEKKTSFWKKIYQKIKNSYTRFYEMRNTKDCPLKFVLSKERELLGYEKRVMAKKREYFHELLNSSLKDRKSGINNNDNKPKNKENRIK
ncbi:hypothetical protein CWI38_0217p0030 [Hamiltosporidium tvaerminnensis]|uniref:Uncharacterized protein n=1 Tax=Hamiltosporidium tvaerminnensis TaxID=1176355 RepID=A0A4Q9LZL1_9MICR|nr:hypothetical protein CWI38_0217p0030 [Hamiltosporidium tvaerminnensis]